jgi:hypothetical protein
MNIIQITRPGLIFRCLITLGIGLLALGIQSPGALGAEKVKLIYGPLKGKISVNSLEKYAATGKMTLEFRVYAKFADRQTLAQLRSWLNSRFECDRQAMSKFASTSEGQKFLQELGTVIKADPQDNGFIAIRSTLMETADVPGKSNGWTILEAMHNFPADDLHVNLKNLVQLKKSWSDNPQNIQAAAKIFAIRAENISAFNPQ